MAVSPEYRDWILEQLREAGTVTPRALFGGVGLYMDGLCFGLMAEDVLYLKVDGTNRPDFEASGTGPFRPYGDERSIQYYEVPADVLEDARALGAWAGKAANAARRAKKR